MSGLELDCVREKCMKVEKLSFDSNQICRAGWRVLSHGYDKLSSRIGERVCVLIQSAG